MAMFERVVALPGARVAAVVVPVALGVAVVARATARRRAEARRKRAMPPPRRGPGRPPGSENRPAPAVGEYLAAEEVRALRSYRRTDPAGYRELLTRRVRERYSVSAPGQFTVAEVQAMLKALDTLGL